MGAMEQESAGDAVVEVRDINTRFGDAVVHEDVNVTVYPGEIFALVGGSGTGKSTLLREIILLQAPISGSIRVFGQEVVGLSDEEALPLRRRWGVMFERGALFSSLTVAENVGMVLHEHTKLDERLIREIAAVKVALTGLPPDAGAKYPASFPAACKRASLARALALDRARSSTSRPRTRSVERDRHRRLVRLRDGLGLTIMMVTHDLDLLWRAADRVAVLGKNHIVGVGTMDELSRATIRSSGNTSTGRAAGPHASRHGSRVNSSRSRVRHRPDGGGDRERALALQRETTGRATKSIRRT
jgi:phospholipid/cholesterol/gamma-HCH transport system ATP-binding protein